MRPILAGCPSHCGKTESGPRENSDCYQPGQTVDDATVEAASKAIPKREVEKGKKY